MTDTTTKPLAPELLETDKPATLYVLGMFGYRRIETRWLKCWVGRFAQYASAVHAEFIEKGKRSRRGLEPEGYRPSLIVLAGHGHIEPRTAFNDRESRPIVDSVTGEKLGTVTTSATRWGSCDPRWAEEFGAALASYLESRPGALLADYRQHDTAENRRAI